MADEKQCATIARKAMEEFTAGGKPLYDRSIANLYSEQIGAGALAARIVYEDAYIPCIKNEAITFTATPKALECAKTARKKMQPLTTWDAPLHDTTAVVSAASSVNTQEIAIGALAGSIAYKDYTKCMGDSGTFFITPPPPAPLPTPPAPRPVEQKRQSGGATPG